MTTLFSLFPSAGSLQREERSRTPAPPVYERDKFLSDKTVPHFSLSTWCVLILRTCGAEKLRFIFVTPLASYK